MTVALILADQANAGLRGQLTALGVRRVDATDRAGPALRSVAAAAQVAGERVLICAGDGAVPEEILSGLLKAGGTAAFTRTGAGALVVDIHDLEALARAAEAPVAPAGIGALIAELRRRGVRVRVLDAGPDGDGAIARLVVEPVASATARWLARRQLTPAALYGIALGLGLLSAVWFADPLTRARVVGSVVLLGSLAVGRLARCWPPASQAASRTESQAASQAARGGSTPPSTGSGPPRACCPNSRSTPPWPSAPVRPARPHAWRDWTASTARTSGTPWSAASAGPGRPACGGWPSPRWSCSASAGSPGSATKRRDRRPDRTPGRCAASRSRSSASRPAKGTR